MSRSLASSSVRIRPRAGTRTSSCERIGTTVTHDASSSPGVAIAGEATDAGSAQFIVLTRCRRRVRASGKNRPTTGRAADRLYAGRKLLPCGAERVDEAGWNASARSGVRATQRRLTDRNSCATSTSPRIRGEAENALDAAIAWRSGTRSHDREQLRLAKRLRRLAQ